MTLLQRSIETYVLAKDGNRPHLIANAFAPDAGLAMDVKTGTIAFPSEVKGAGEIARVFDLAFRRHEDRARAHRISVGIKQPVARRGGDVDRPVAGARDVALTAFFEGLEGAELVALLVVFRVLRIEGLAEFVVQAFRSEVALLLGNPFMEPEVGLDDELGHECSSLGCQQQVGASSSLTRRVRIIFT